MYNNQSYICGFDFLRPIAALIVSSLLPPPSLCSYMNPALSAKKKAVPHFNWKDALVTLHMKVKSPL